MPAAAIAVECASESTIENAAYSAPILRAMGVRSALLVTSWFHTRRALACFQKEAPAIRWMTAPVERGGSLWHLLRDHGAADMVAEEYLKLAYYALRYGISLAPETQATHGAEP